MTRHFPLVAVAADRDAVASPLRALRGNGPGAATFRSVVQALSASPFLDLSGGLDDARNRPHDTLELRYFNAQSLASGSCELVIASPPIACRCSPLRADPPFDQHALQRRVERPLFHLQHIFRLLLD